MMARILLSYSINTKTPTYGNNSNIEVKQVKKISNGDSCNAHELNMNLHSGTHIDIPNHFFDIEFDANSLSLDFWFFKKILYLEFQPSALLINNQLVNLLNESQDLGYKILIIRTGAGSIRGEEDFWKKTMAYMAM